MSGGLTSTGFVARPQDEILADLVSDEQTSIATDVDTSAESLLGQVNAIMAARFRELWELGATVYAARDPSGASFASLDAVSAITGTVRLDATKGVVSLTVTLSPGTTLAIGAVASVAGQPTNRWVTTQAASVGLGAGSPQPVTVTAQAQTAGVFTAPAGTITVIATPQTGWVSVTNSRDAMPGNGVEADAALRVRRELELSHAGGTNIDAMRTRLLELKTAEGNLVVASCFVDENASAYTDSLGRPPNTMEVVLQFGPGHSDPDAQTVLAAALWAGKPGGISLVGSNALTTVDGNGVTRTVLFNTPDAVNIYVTTTVAVGAGYLGDFALAGAIVAYGNGLGMGKSVVLSKLEGTIVFEPGVNDVVALGLGLSALTSEQNITIGPRQIATFSTGAQCVVTSS